MDTAGQRLAMDEKSRAGREEARKRASALPASAKHLNGLSNQSGHTLVGACDRHAASIIS
jgi:hypothetical protein